MGSEHSQTAHILGTPYIFIGMNITTVRSVLAWIIKVVWSLKSCSNASRWIYGDWLIAATWLEAVDSVPGVTGIWAYTHHTLINYFPNATLAHPWFLVLTETLPVSAVLWVCFFPGGRQDALIVILWLVPASVFTAVQLNREENLLVMQPEACCH